MENGKFIHLCEFGTIVINSKILIWTYTFFHFPNFHINLSVESPVFASREFS